MIFSLVANFWDHHLVSHLYLAIPIIRIFNAVAFSFQDTDENLKPSISNIQN